MQEVENLQNDLLEFFCSFTGALGALEDYDVRKNVFKFLDRYGTIHDILKNELLKQTVTNRSLVPEYLEERIRSQPKWFKGDDQFSLEFAGEFLRRKFSKVRGSFRAPQPSCLAPPVAPPRKHRSGSGLTEASAQTASPSMAVYGYTASGRPRRNSAPITVPSPSLREIRSEAVTSVSETRPEEENENRLNELSLQENSRTSGTSGQIEAPEVAGPEDATGESTTPSVGTVPHENGSPEGERKDQGETHTTEGSERKRATEVVLSNIPESNNNLIENNSINEKIQNDDDGSPRPEAPHETAM